MSAPGDRRAPPPRRRSASRPDPAALSSRSRELSDRIVETVESYRGHRRELTDREIRDALDHASDRVAPARGRVGTIVVTSLLSLLTIGAAVAYVVESVTAESIEDMAVWTPVILLAVIGGILALLGRLRGPPG